MSKAQRDTSDIALRLLIFQGKAYEECLEKLGSSHTINILQAFTPSHVTQQRKQIAEWLLGNSHVLDCLWFSDEAHFYLCGYVNILIVDMVMSMGLCQ